MTIFLVKVECHRIAILAFLMFNGFFHLAHDIYSQQMRSRINSDKTVALALGDQVIMRKKYKALVDN